MSLPSLKPQKGEIHGKCVKIGEIIEAEVTTCSQDDSEHRDSLETDRQKWENVEEGARVKIHVVQKKGIQNPRTSYPLL